jgi:hypothetical protein
VPANVVDRAGRGGALAEFDYSHPILELFKAPRSGDLTTARFFRYRAVTMKPEPPAAKKPGQAPASRVIARFDDGAVAMAERTIGTGNVVVWSSTLDNYWNDLAQKPVYLPLIHQIVRHLASYEEPPMGYTIGQVVDPARVLQTSGFGVQSGSGAMILTPSGHRVEQSGTPTPVQLDEPGFYEIHGRSNQAGIVTLASNVDTAESDLAMLDTQEMKAALAGGAAGVTAAAAENVPTPEDQERRQNFWWYLLMIGIALLGLETFISNRMKGPIEGTTLTPTLSPQ